MKRERVVESVWRGCLGQLFSHYRFKGWSMEIGAIKTCAPCRNKESKEHNDCSM